MDDEIFDENDEVFWMPTDIMDAITYGDLDFTQMRFLMYLIHMTYGNNRHHVPLDLDEAARALKEDGLDLTPYVESLIEAKVVLRLKDNVLVNPKVDAWKHDLLRSFQKRQREERKIIPFQEP